MKMKKTKKFKGKNVVISGGSKGLGKELCRSFVEEGAKVVFTLMEKGPSKSIKVKAFKCDLRNKKEIDSCAKDIKKFFNGRVDILVNNAGFNCLKPLNKMNYEEINSIIKGNLTGHIYFTKQFISALKKSKGHIVNIASKSGVSGDPTDVPYSSAKAGLIGFTKSLARYCGAKVIVTSVSPSWVKTDFIKKYKKKDVNQSLKKSVIQRIHSPKEIAEFVLFLCSQRSITGNNIVIDGGGMIQ